MYIYPLKGSESVETAKEMRAMVVGKATEDADFRAWLLSDPKGAINEELGVAIPASMSIQIHERERHDRGSGSSPSSRLSEHDLQAITAGGYKSRLTELCDSLEETISNW